MRKRIVFYGRVQGVGLNNGQFITIEWMDTEEIPLETGSGFSVR